MTGAPQRRSAVAGAAHAAPIFSALGDPMRLSLLARLGSAGPQSTARLTEGSAVTRQAITKHLLILDDAGLVRSVRRGRERIWACDRGRLDAARKFLDGVSLHWDETLDRLKKFVEE